MSYLFSFLMSVTAVFLILLVLIQRGRGGGLAGAFGGMGGQSAFGTKAGDLFTRITMVTATFWILLCVAAIAVLNSQRSAFGTASPGSTPNAPSEGGRVRVTPARRATRESRPRHRNRLPPPQAPRPHRATAPAGTGEKNDTSP